MTGIAYYRIKQNLSRSELSQKAGVAKETVSLYEKLAARGKGRIWIWLKFSDCLAVSVDELLRDDFPDLIDRTDPHKFRTSRTANPNNPITNYYLANRLTFGELATRLGRTSRECARVVCSAEKASDAHLNTLAAYENMTKEEFIKKYSN